jgi:hypothetical protein
VLCFKASVTYRLKKENLERGLRPENLHGDFVERLAMKEISLLAKMKKVSGN